MKATSATVRIALVAHEAGVGDDGTVETVGHHPDEVVRVVDLEQVSHQRLGGVSRGLEAAVQRLAGELDGAVRGAFVVAGQHRPQVQLGAVAHSNRNRRDERGQTLTTRAQEFLHHAGEVEHRGERISAAYPAGQRLLRNHRCGARPVPQQGDLADDHSWEGLGGGVVPVDSGVADLGLAGADEQEGHCKLALVHQYLPWRRGQRSQLRGQRHEVVDGAACEDFERGQFVGTDIGQA